MVWGFHLLHILPNICRSLSLILALPVGVWSYLVTVLNWVSLVCWEWVLVLSVFTWKYLYLTLILIGYFLWLQKSKVDRFSFQWLFPAWHCSISPWTCEIQPLDKDLPQPSGPSLPALPSPCSFPCLRYHAPQIHLSQQPQTPISALSEEWGLSAWSLLPAPPPKSGVEGVGMWSLHNVLPSPKDASLCWL